MEMDTQNYTMILLSRNNPCTKEVKTQNHMKVVEPIGSQWLD